MTDEAQSIDEAPAEEAPVEPSKTAYVEFVGFPPYGTEFYKGSGGTHSITNAHMREHHDVDLGMEEAVWKRGANGRFLVKQADLTPGAVEVLANDPAFQLVDL